MIVDQFKEAREILREAVREHQPSHVFALFSGGHDSLCATHIASQHPKFSGVVHVNTTIGIEETREFVRETCRKHQWPLKEYRPPVAFRDIVMEHGFPGPGGHRFMYIRLKERCIADLVREHKTRWNDRIVLVTGVRAKESSRRMGHVEPVIRDKARVWTAPIVNWSDDDKNEYMRRNWLARNPVVDQLCMSGECLCGSFAQPNELLEIAALFPSAAAEIRAIEADAEAAGVHAKWGTRPPTKPDPNQFNLPLCWSCEAKIEELEEDDNEQLRYETETGAS